MNHMLKNLGRRTPAQLAAERRYNHSLKGRMRAQRYYYSPKGYEAYFRHNEMKRADRQWRSLERDEPEVFEELCRSARQLSLGWDIKPQTPTAVR